MVTEVNGSVPCSRDDMRRMTVILGVMLTTLLVLAFLADSSRALAASWGTATVGIAAVEYWLVGLLLSDIVAGRIWPAQAPQPK